MSKYDKVIQTFMADGANKPLGLSVHVWGIRRDIYINNIVLHEENKY